MARYLTPSPYPVVVVIVSSDTEWRVSRPEILRAFPGVVPCAGSSPYGEAIGGDIKVGEQRLHLVFLHGGWGKINAAASAQYAIDRWRPNVLINLGTCGGFEGVVELGEILLVTRTIVYDIVEQMSDPDAAIAHYISDLDLAWLQRPFPQPVRQGWLVSADRDLIGAEVSDLHRRFGALGGDWESGAIAHVAKRNGLACLILRGVTDLVGESGSEAYDGTLEVFTRRAAEVMRVLITSLDQWLACMDWSALAVDLEGGL